MKSKSNSLARLSSTIVPLTLGLSTFSTVSRDLSCTIPSLMVPAACIIPLSFPNLFLISFIAFFISLGLATSADNIKISPPFCSTDFNFSIFLEISSSGLCNDFQLSHSFFSGNTERFNKTILA